MAKAFSNKAKKPYKNWGSCGVESHVAQHEKCGVLHCWVFFIYIAENITSMFFIGVKQEASVIAAPSPVELM